MNNAAVGVHGGGDGSIVDTVDNWRRIFDINLFGILNGVAAFLPAMLEAGHQAMIVNTGSKQGLTHPPGNAAYNTVKAAVNGYTMNLARDLRARDSKVSAHLLVPGWTTTGDNEHRKGAWLPDQVADHLVDHLEAGDFYIICPDDETSSETDRKRILWQSLDIIENRPALSRWHDDYAGAFAEFMKKPLG
jgi:NAD(P)-dependent dehydrogenase (short-subunit alcohol dehydrogenase family)